MRTRAAGVHGTRGARLRSDLHKPTSCRRRTSILSGVKPGRAPDGLHGQTRPTTRHNLPMRLDAINRMTTCDSVKIHEIATRRRFGAVGSTTGKGNGKFDVYLVKFDAKGKILWEKYLGTPADDYGNSVIETANGNFVITGTSLSDPAMQEQILIYKTNANGDIEP